MADLKSYEINIEKAGFGLEFKVSRVLKEQGWSIINNRYYLDDHQETVREIDILAYKISIVDGVKVVTALILSCKQSSAHDWVMLSKDVDRDDPNADWQPLHAWSNYKPVSFYSEKKDWAHLYHERLKSRGVKLFEIPDEEVFAFQEMHKESGVCKNDSAIYGSLTTLMKAQSYEMSRLPERMAHERFYQFNMISVVDTGLVRMHYADDGHSASYVDAIDYNTRYILRRKEVGCRIKILKFDALAEQLREYEHLHQVNCKVFEELSNDFFDGIVEDIQRREYLLPEFRSALGLLKYYAYSILDDFLNVDEATLEYSEELGLELCFPDGGHKIELLNDDDKCVRIVRGALKNIYRYEGDFKFSEDIPF